MHFLFTALGSYGDVLPMVGLGAELRRRGHEVTVVTNPHFQSVVENAGLTLSPMGTAEEYDELARHPDLWHPLRGAKFLLGYTASWLPQLYETIEQEYQPGKTTLVAHGLDLASRTFHDKHAAPLATVHYAPLALRSMHQTPNFIGPLTQPPTPRWLKRMQFWLADKCVLDPLIGKPVNRLRARLDLLPVSRVYRSWHNSPQLTLCLWPEWFGAVQPDWPESAQVAGFPLWDANPDETLGSEVEEFLAAGDPPIGFAPGSANAQAARFFETAVEVCRRLGRRGVLLTKYADQIPEELPSSVRHVSYVPFSRLLPKLAAMVHHGGIGTSSQSLAAGVPQLVMPLAYDQLDNATRLSKLGVANWVKPKHFRPGKVSDQLSQLLDNPKVEQNCQLWHAKCDGPQAIGRACDLLEELGT